MVLCLSVTQLTSIFHSLLSPYLFSSSSPLPETPSLLQQPPSPTHLTVTCNTLTYHLQVYKDLNFCDLQISLDLFTQMVQTRWESIYTLFGEQPSYACLCSKRWTKSHDTLADIQTSNPYWYSGSSSAKQSTSSHSFFLLTVGIPQLRSAYNTV